LDFSISGRALTETLTSNGVNFIHEDNAGLMVACVVEHFADDTRALANVFVDDSR
jgi:hypothetical protein